MTETAVYALVVALISILVILCGLIRKCDDLEQKLNMIERNVLHSSTNKDLQ